MGKMTKEEFVEFLKAECPKLIFEPVAKVDEFFNPYIENDTIEGFDYDFDTDNTVKILFKFKDGSDFTVTIGKGE